MAAAEESQPSGRGEENSLESNAALGLPATEPLQNPIKNAESRPHSRPMNQHLWGGRREWEGV